MSDDGCGLIISAEELLRIQQACIRRRAELELTGGVPPLRTASELAEGAPLVSPALEVSVQPLCSSLAPGSTESAFAAAKVSPPVPPLEPGFWQALLYGSPDSLLSDSDVTRALQLVTEKLGRARDPNETLPALRAGQLRKHLRTRFGYAQAEQTMIALWRSAPSPDGTPQPNEDQSSLTPGVWDCPRFMPAWRREFRQEFSNEQQVLESIGGWSGD
jgi:hypothetical protein